MQLLGTVQVAWNDAPLKFATEHARGLLAYLVVEADVVHQRTTLATLLWPDEDATRARQNLRQALFFLKKALSVVAGCDAFLQITAKTIQWKSRDARVDLHTFQERWRLSQTHSHANVHACPTCIDSYREAIALYRGEFLQGLSLKDNQPFEEWALFLREQFHRQAMAMLGALITYHMAAGAYEQAQRYANCQVVLEPWHEEGHRHLMQALAGQGLQSTALRQYESCRRTLQQELGLPPSAETTRLYAQIRAGNLSVALPSKEQAATIRSGLPLPEQAESAPALEKSPQRMHNLPVNLAPLVGRGQQLEQLRTLIDKPAQRLVTIVGMGGMGKTRLALALLEQLVAESPVPFTDGVWFVPLIGVSPSAATLPDALAGAIVKALGMTAPNQGSLQSALFHYLAQARLLLVFDSFEHLLLEESTAAAATEFVLALLHAAPEATVLATSRLPLHLLAESVIRLEGLPVPNGSAPKVDERDAANYESVRLFLYHAQRTLPDFVLSDENLPAVIELCRALGGMPLAIELAAALIPHFTPSELVAAIGQDLTLLVSARRDLDVRHRQLSVVLQSSWQLLSASEQQVLAQSAIFMGRFSRAAAQAVTGATVSDLASLVDKSLLQQPEVGVYQLHHLLRQFAADKLHTTPQEATAVADRHPGLLQAAHPGPRTSRRHPRVHLRRRRMTKAPPARKGKDLPGRRRSDSSAPQKAGRCG